jgi:hypothetical protein
MNKRYSPVLFIFQPVKDVLVENENGDNWLATFKSMIQSGVVVQSKVSSKPKNIYCGLHIGITTASRKCSIQ